MKNLYSVQFDSNRREYIIAESLEEALALAKAKARIPETATEACDYTNVTEVTYLAQVFAGA